MQLSGFVAGETLHTGVCGIKIISHKRQDYFPTTVRVSQTVIFHALQMLTMSTSSGLSNTTGSVISAKYAIQRAHCVV